MSGYIWEVTARRHLSNLSLLNQFLYSSSQYSSLGRGGKKTFMNVSASKKAYHLSCRLLTTGELLLGKQKFCIIKFITVGDIIPLCQFIRIDLYPGKPNTRTPYVHLFTFLQHVLVIPFDHYQIVNNKVISGEVCYGRGLSFTISLIKYIKLAIIPSKGIIHKILVKISS